MLIINNVQQCQANLIEHESKMMTKESFPKSSNNAGSAPVPSNLNNNNNKTMKATQENSKISASSTAGHTEAVLTPARNATKKLMAKRMMQPCPTCLEFHPRDFLAARMTSWGRRL
jgi:hypothetical protein